MNSITGLSPQALRRAADIKERIDTLQDELTELLGAEPSEESHSRNGRGMSSAGKARIAAAAKARWAAYRLAKGKTEKAGPAKKRKRRMSAAGRAAISAAAKARWAKARAAGRSRL